MNRSVDLTGQQRACNKILPPSSQIPLKCYLSSALQNACLLISGTKQQTTNPQHGRTFLQCPCIIATHSHGEDFQLHIRSFHCLTDRIFPYTPEPYCTESCINGPINQTLQQLYFNFAAITHLSASIDLNIRKHAC